MNRILIKQKMSLKEFEVLKIIGTGAFSTVQKVRRIQDNQIYALKKMHLSTFSKKEKENALNEIRILASIKSPYVITYKQAFLDQNLNYLCLITQYADGGDLEQKILKIKNSGTNQLMSQIEIWNIFNSVCKGLRDLHSLNIAHRDIKPANIFLFKDGRVKIGDMNVSKILKGSLCQTQTGTPYYASPQIWKDIQYSIKSDIWSFGCIVYEMATSHPPFEADSMEKLYRKVVRGIFPKVSSMYSKELRGVIRKMIQVQPQNRASVQQLLNESMSIRKTTENEQDFDSLKSCQLIETIRMPKKMSQLANRLPEPNYSPKQFRSAKNYEGIQVPRMYRKASYKVLPTINSIHKFQNNILPKINKINKVKSEKLISHYLPPISCKSDERFLQSKF